MEDNENTWKSNLLATNAAKQFAPFAALDGMKNILQEEERQKHSTDAEFEPFYEDYRIY